mmetsp:Transcript_49440/g.127588  ORF Transcript_49440/g.127588 Transcript_49440/m.127588 type:complete len:388 (-) Transcript_49440:228-1391(-)
MEALLHAVRDSVAVHLRGLCAGEGHDADVGPANQLQVLHLLDALGYPSRRADDLPRGLHVSALTKLAERRPCGRHGPARAGACHGGRGVDAAGPVGDVAVHVTPQLARGEEHDGGALGCEAVLVGVARDGRHARHAEVGLRRREAGLVHEGVQEPAKAAVHVQANLLPQRDLREVLYGVDRAVGVLAAGAHDRHGVAVDQARNMLQVHLLRGGHGPRFLDEDAEVVPGLVERGVRGVADHYVGIRDALHRPAPVPVGLHGHDDALRAAGREAAAAVGAAFVHVDHHQHHLGVHLPQGRMDARMQRVREGPLGVDLPDEGVVVLAPVVDRTRDLAVGPVLRVQLLPLRDELQQLLLRHAFRRQPRAWAGELLLELGLHVSDRLHHLLL